MKFDSWFTPRGPMHLGPLEKWESFCGVVESTTERTGGRFYDGGEHETTAKQIELHTSEAFPPPERYCKRCAKKALAHMEDA